MSAALSCRTMDTVHAGHGPARSLIESASTRPRDAQSLVRAIANRRARRPSGSPASTSATAPRNAGRVGRRDPDIGWPIDHRGHRGRDDRRAAGQGIPGLHRVLAPGVVARHVWHQQGGRGGDELARRASRQCAFDTDVRPCDQLVPAVGSSLDRTGEPQLDIRERGGHGSKQGAVHALVDPPDIREVRRRRDRNRVHDVGRAVRDDPHIACTEVPHPLSHEWRVRDHEVGVRCGIPVASPDGVPAASSTDEGREVPSVIGIEYQDEAPGRARRVPAQPFGALRVRHDDDDRGVGSRGQLPLEHSIQKTPLREPERPRVEHEVRPWTGDRGRPGARGVVGGVGAGERPRWWPAMRPPG